MLKIVNHNLKGVPETLLIPLWARAIEAEQSRPIIKDCMAAKMMEEIEYDFSKFDKEWPTQVSVVIRSELLDKATRKFINKNPNAVIINLDVALILAFSS